MSEASTETDVPAEVASSGVAPTTTPPAFPPYTQSLLRVKVPVSVTLAVKKQPIARIIELGPGSIIHFDKSCEELLDVTVGAQHIAAGEPVKVGDKFGIRLVALAAPGERFRPIRKPGS